MYSENGDEQGALAERAFRPSSLRRSTRFPIAPSIAFDFATALPRITSGAIDTTTPKRPQVTLTPAAPLTGADGGFVVLQWMISVMGDSFTSGMWTFVVPADASYAPNQQYPADVQSVVFVESDLIPDYAALKKLPISQGGAPVS